VQEKQTQLNEMENVQESEKLVNGKKKACQSIYDIFYKRGKPQKMKTLVIF
jgi:hypothetical protein